MTGFDVGAFAWALADSVRGLLNGAERTRVCAKIGAGEHDSAIADLLEVYTKADAELPYALAAPTRRWIDGYTGSEKWHTLRRVYDLIRVSAVTAVSSESAIVESGCPPQRLVAARSERATRKCATRRTARPARRAAILGVTACIEDLVDYAVEARRVAHTATEVAVREARSLDWTWERIALALGGHLDAESLRRAFG